LLHFTCSSPAVMMTFRSPLPLAPFLWCMAVIQIVEDLHTSLSLTDPLVLMKPQEACSTADVYRVRRRQNEPQSPPKSPNSSRF